MKITTIPAVYRNVNRWGEILTVLSKYGLAGWLSRFDLDFAKGWLRTRDGEALARMSSETRIRMALMELGPTFIKLGQILSTRPDLVGVELASELTHLQADVKADRPEQVRRLVEAELGEPIEVLFAEFDDQPLASASIAQVHRARLHSGEEVVVKVQHVGIEKTVTVDLEILSGLAQFAEMHPDLVNYRPRATVAEFQRTLRREIDFGREERNMQQFASDFAGDESVHIPRVYPELSTSRVLTMERLNGVKLADAELVVGREFDLKEIAQRGADLYLKMIFDHGFYHADPHPGNILLLDGNTIGLLDFGMVGRLDEGLREEIENMLLAIVDREAGQLTAIITRIGETPSDLDLPGLSNDVTEFVSYHGNVPLSEFELGKALGEMTEIIRRYRIMLPAQIALLLKSLIMLDGTARLADPSFSLIDALRPHRRRLLRQRLSPARRLKKMRRIAGELEQLAEVLPRRLIDLLGQMQSGKFDVHLDHRGLEPSVNRLVLGMLASAIFLGSALMLSMKAWPSVTLFEAQISLSGSTGVLLSAGLGLRLLRAINKSGHLDRRG
ncbi:MAG: AarF/ABC1/UbiB kinase family protein [Planctomycetota bacterium]|nr:MAG: AarF/ABC1/UbiB kinase family protein [Planctomycetota bacterium]REK18567.1 MAG: AarF/ABC1/UbiB kinase family protein [Planctomycetota bacterium]REK49214.1 MAG: AarF/ABC1/UbiB kinase family protein [Planctomycetota bacterium]